eukprot:4454970-Lingulodinium_polyedra.AAC.1
MASPTSGLGKPSLPKRLGERAQREAMGREGRAERAAAREAVLGVQHRVASVRRALAPRRFCDLAAQ